MTVFPKLLYLLLLFSIPCSAETLRIAAASDLRYVLPELATQFEQQTGHQLAMTFAASGNLTTQIRHGAPYDIFFSANPAYIKLLADAGLTRGNVVDYAAGQLALFVGNNSQLDIEKGWQGIEQALLTNNINKFAIANPLHAPYGQAAKTVLQHQALWSQLEPRLLLAENASQVTQFALTPEVSAALIPYTHAIQPQIAAMGKYFKVDDIYLQQQAVVLHNALDIAAQFLYYIESEPAKQLFIKYGFNLDKTN